MVVIPWRGFRCFTPDAGYAIAMPASAAMVVIPWRGFRCFTRRAADAPQKDTETVVIPWRGFRCFTPDLAEKRVAVAQTVGCNPLAGI